MSEPIFIKCDRLLTKIEQDRFMYEIKKKMDDQPVILLPPYMDVVHPVQRWIPVTERMPEVGEWVLCQCRANIFEVLKLDSDRSWVKDAHHIYMSGFVLAWMPLPEPYTEVKNNDNDQ